jgi:putative peptidoglycan binding protein/penicillin-insensitive murein endopeptidase
MPRRTRLPLIALVVALLSVAAAGVAAAGTPIYPHQSAGNRGSDVRALQGLLRERGATDLYISGIFDTPTVAAVRAFQTARGLPVTGMVDAGTWVRLIIRLEPGATGEAVKVVQRELNDKRRAGVTVNGVLSGATVTAVRSFQRHAALPVTGVVDPGTWRYLIGHFESPVFGRWMCGYEVGNGPAHWGTGAAIGQVRAAAVTMGLAGKGPIAIGDVSFQHGGDMPGHETHARGLDVDIRIMRRDEKQCQWGGNYRMAVYDRTATRALVKAIRAAAPGHIKVIYFNDPVLIKEGLTRYHVGHDDHVHVRYCERVYPLATYDC